MFKKKEIENRRKKEGKKGGREEEKETKNLGIYSTCSREEHYYSSYISLRFSI